MDPLSEILSFLKPRSYITAGFDAGGGWSLRLDDLAGRIKCYAVISGGCWLSLEGAGEPVDLVAGGCFVLPSGRPVRIASDLALEPTLASEALAPDRNGEMVTYNGGGDVLLVGSRFEVNGRHAEALPTPKSVGTGDGKSMPPRKVCHGGPVQPWMWLASCPKGEAALPRG